MQRFRLRFLLQEFDLPLGSTLIGRGTDCAITIEDALVSRNHARLDATPQGVVVHDLGSRNGVRVNTIRIDGAQALSHGDRVRIGNQELVFAIVESKAFDAKTTGFLRYCANCDIPHPAESPACPHCGATELRSEDTVSGARPQEPTQWQLKLLVEMLQRASERGQRADVERLFSRLEDEFAPALAAAAISSHEAEAILTAAAAVACRMRVDEGARWVALQAVRVPHPSSEAFGATIQALCSAFVGELPLWRNSVGEQQHEWERARTEAWLGNADRANSPR